MTREDGFPALPEAFRARVSATFAGGAAWLDRLPALLVACEERWGLTLGPPFELSYNYVAPATLRDGSQAVLKAGAPSLERRTEVAALRLYAGRGAVHLLDADETAGLALLERLQPGEMLVTLGDDEAMTRVAAGLMRDLWRPLHPDHPFPTVADWGKGFGRLRDAFDGGTGPFPEELVLRAETLFADLVASAGPPVLLHGDLHHMNILSAQRAPWLAIDPKGVAGEPGYDVGAFVRNPHPTIDAYPDARTTFSRRLAIFAEELGLDRDRLAATCFAQSVLSAWWSYEDHAEDGSWREALRFVEVFASLA